jgi:hypothetical protein
MNYQPCWAARSPEMYSFLHLRRFQLNWSRELHWFFLEQTFKSKFDVNRSFGRSIWTCCLGHLFVNIVFVASLDLAVFAQLLASGWLCILNATEQLPAFSVFSLGFDCFVANTRKPLLRSFFGPRIGSVGASCLRWFCFLLRWRFRFIFWSFFCIRVQKWSFVA